MTPSIDSTRARRYLLGEATEQEASVIEHEYFENGEAIDDIAAVEDDLIEDYLAGQLNAAERDRFERVYLSSPRHRARVETVRKLLELGARSRHGTSTTGAARVTRRGQWLALAAALIVIASVGWLWLLSSSRPPAPQVATTNVPQPAPAPNQPPAPAPVRASQVFALTISPVAVRGSSDIPSTVVPAGTDVVSIRLEGDGENRSLTARRAIVKTVGGREVWRGLVTTDSSLPSGVVARIDLPAARLPGEDYLITLYGADQTGAETEWVQYFLRVRNR